MKITKHSFVIDRISKKQCLNSWETSIDRTVKKIYEETGEYYYDVYLNRLGGKTFIDGGFESEKVATSYINKILKNLKNKNAINTKTNKEKEKKIKLELKLKELKLKIAKHDIVCEKIQNDQKIIDKIMNTI